jgi:dihydrolipoamide dehydrogenase
VLVKVGDTIRASPGHRGVRQGLHGDSLQPLGGQGAQGQLGDKVAEGSVLLSLEVAGEGRVCLRQYQANEAAAPVESAQAAINIEASSYTGSTDLDCDVLVLGGGPAATAPRSAPTWA